MVAAQGGCGREERDGRLVGRLGSKKRTQGNGVAFLAKWGGCGGSEEERFAIILTHSFHAFAIGAFAHHLHRVVCPTRFFRRVTATARAAGEWYN